MRGQFQNNTRRLNAHLQNGIQGVQSPIYIGELTKVWTKDNGTIDVYKGGKSLLEPPSYHFYEPILKVPYGKTKWEPIVYNGSVALSDVFINSRGAGNDNLYAMHAECMGAKAGTYVTPAESGPFTLKGYNNNEVRFDLTYTYNDPTIFKITGNWRATTYKAGGSNTGRYWNQMIGTVSSSVNGKTSMSDSTLAEYEACRYAEVTIAPVLRPMYVWPHVITIYAWLPHSSGNPQTLRAYLKLTTDSTY